MSAQGRNALIGNWRRLLAHAGLAGHYRAVSAALAIAIALVALFAIMHFWPASSADAYSIDRAPVPSSSSSASAPASSSSTSQGQLPQDAASSSSQGGIVVVDVEGCVATPGVYRLPAGSRVIDAVNAAGGVAEGGATSPVNQARMLVDGEQVYIPSAAEVAQGASAGSASVGASAGGSAGASADGSAQAGSAASGGLVNINSATAAELDTLPGIGPSTAEKIIAEREANGPYESIDDLQRVSGIGEKKIEQIRGLACV